MLDPSSEMLADQFNLLKIYFYNYEGKIQSCITAKPHIVALLPTCSHIWLNTKKDDKRRQSVTTAAYRPRGNMTSDHTEKYIASRLTYLTPAADSDL